MLNFQQYAELYRNQLLNEVVPFWTKHSIDHQNGGFFTCIDENGKVYDTDKFMWLQGRQVWLFSMLYNNVQKKSQWLQIAQKGAQFLIKHGRNTQGLWYFSVTNKGEPLVEPYSIFSDCFATMAFAELYKATKHDAYKDIALKTYESIESRQDNPKGKWSKGSSGRQLKNFALPMILCNLALILQDILGKQKVDSMVKPLIDTIMTQFLNKEHNILVQNVGPSGEFVDCHEGRVINCGHGNQSLWFILDLAERFKDQNLKQKCVDILISTIQYGWDKEHGGIFYFKDIKGFPPQQLEWDQKLWWVHIQTMIALIKAYKATGRQVCLEWFKKIHEYTWSHFRDQKGGEWWGYLNRQGEVLLRLKGGKWKGCFHVPRGLFQLWKVCESFNAQ